MYQLYKLDEDLYQIHSKYSSIKSMEGTLLAVLTYATYNLGFDPNELELALLDMLDLDEDGAEFGINKTFMFSFDRSGRKTG